MYVNKFYFYNINKYHFLVKYYPVLYENEHCNSSLSAIFLVSQKLIIYTTIIFFLTYVNFGLFNIS
ncbi:hypothetical protein PITCH_A840010 [uncultured Desulfobacterium sp.]|uniref:Uncharacterized protein n=1 Tax=uncultured Desulfobacterium sp. TaxID=201089 RepID=A0A445N353_9BACT|nr:hypothetical protein PITCH_A840010 [uncultured Desulfobacterium sp.]